MFSLRKYANYSVRNSINACINNAGFRLSTPWSTSIPLCTTLTTGASGEVPPPTTPPVTPPIISVTVPTGLLPVAPPVTPPIAPVTPPITLVNPPTGYRQSRHQLNHLPHWLWFLMGLLSLQYQLRYPLHQKLILL